MFYAESQGPWNGSCSLKVLQPGGFMGHPGQLQMVRAWSTTWRPQVEPNTRSRLLTERKRVQELVPYAVVFPYIRMGRSISGFMVDRTGGKFGPFENQIFIGDFSLSVVMRATTEKVNGVWQGACYPFREGLATGMLACQFTPQGNFIVGGTNRGWPVRGPREFADAAARLDRHHSVRGKRINALRRRFPSDVHKAGRSRDRVRPRFVCMTDLHAHLPAGLRKPRSGPDHTRESSRRACPRIGGRSNSRSRDWSRSRPLLRLLAPIRSERAVGDLVPQPRRTTRWTRFPNRQRCEAFPERVSRRSRSMGPRPCLYPHLDAEGIQEGSRRSRSAPTETWKYLTFPTPARVGASTGQGMPNVAPDREAVKHHIRGRESHPGKHAQTRQRTPTGFNDRQYCSTPLGLCLEVNGDIPGGAP